MTKVKEFCHFYVVHRRDAEPAEVFIKKLSLCALCVSAVSYSFSHFNGLTDGGGDHGLNVFQFGIGGNIAAGLQNKALRTELSDQAGAVSVNIVRIA